MLNNSSPMNMSFTKSSKRVYIDGLNMLSILTIYYTFILSLTAISLSLV